MADELVKKPESFNDSAQSTTTETKESSTTGKTLDGALLAQIMAGLAPGMTDAQIEAFAKNMLLPVLNAELEASQQSYETTKLAKEQEIANLAATLQRSIQEQQNAYRQSVANVETAALSRGMGRSSYTTQAIAGQGNALAKAILQLTEDNARSQNQIQQQITQAAQQNAQTQGRLNTDYASQLAAKIQELRENQRTEYNQNYMTAVSGAMGSKTDGASTTNASGGSQTVTGRIENNGNDAGVDKDKNTATGGSWVTVKK